MDLYKEAKQNRIDFQSEIDALELTEQSVENLRIKYLGRKSQLARLFSQLPSLNKEEKGSN